MMDEKQKRLSGERQRQPRRRRQKRGEKLEPEASHASAHTDASDENNGRGGRISGASSTYSTTSSRQRASRKTVDKVAEKNKNVINPNGNLPQRSAGESLTTTTTHSTRSRERASRKSTEKEAKLNRSSTNNVTERNSHSPTRARLNTSSVRSRTRRPRKDKGGEEVDQEEEGPDDDPLIDSEKQTTNRPGAIAYSPAGQRTRSKNPTKKLSSDFLSESSFRDASEILPVSTSDPMLTTSTDDKNKSEKVVEAGDAIVAQIVGDGEFIDEDEKVEIQKKAEQDAELKLPQATSLSNDDEAARLHRFKRNRIISLVTLVVLLVATAVTLALVLLGGSTNNGDDNNNEAENPANDDGFDSQYIDKNVPTTSPTPQPPTFQNFGGDECGETAIIEGPNIQGDAILFSGSDHGASKDPYRATCTGQANGEGIWYSVRGNGKRLIASTCQNTIFDTQISVYEGKSCEIAQCVVGNDQFCGSQSQVAWFAEDDVLYYVLVHGRRGSKGNFTFSLDALPDNGSCESAYSFDFESGDFDVREFGSTLGISPDAPAASDIPTCPDQLGGFPPRTGAGVWYKFVGPEDDALDARAGLDTSLTDFNGGVSVFKGSDDDGCSDLQCIGFRVDGDVSWPFRKDEIFYIFVQGNGEGDNGNFFLHFTTRFGGFGLLPVPSPNYNCKSATFITPDRSPLRGQTQDYLFDIPFIERTCGNLVFFTSLDYGWFYTIGTGQRMQATTCGPTATFDTQLSIFRGTCTDLICVDGNDESLSCSDNDVGQSTVSWYSIANETYYIVVHGVASRYGSYELTVIDLPSETAQSCEDVTITTDDDDDDDLNFIWADGTAILGSTEDGLINDDDNQLLICLMNNDNNDNESTATSFFMTWYKLIGTGSTITASTCDSPTESKVVIVTLEGDNEDDCNFTNDSTSCSDIIVDDITSTVCGNGNVHDDDDRMLLSWNSNKGMIYYIVVYHPSTIPPGDITLRVEETVYNDSCENSIGPLSVKNGGPIWGSIRTARLTTIGNNNDRGVLSSSTTVPSTCSYLEGSSSLSSSSSMLKGLWYTVIGNGSRFIASTCNGYTNFESIIYILLGDTCNSLSCSIDNDNDTNNNNNNAVQVIDDCEYGNGFSISWLTSKDVLYKIFISGKESVSDNTGGNFQLSIFDDDEEEAL